jgi:hypothetical protein
MAASPRLTAATFVLDDEELDGPAGTFVVVHDPAVHRRAVAADPGSAVLALGGPPTFEPSASEWIERARPFIRSDPARARRSSTGCEWRGPSRRG